MRINDPYCCKEMQTKNDWLQDDDGACILNICLPISYMNTDIDPPIIVHWSPFLGGNDIDNDDDGTVSPSVCPPVNNSKKNWLHSGRGGDKDGSSNDNDGTSCNVAFFYRVREVWGQREGKEEKKKKKKKNNHLCHLSHRGNDNNGGDGGSSFHRVRTPIDIAQEEVDDSRGDCDDEWKKKKKNHTCTSGRGGGDSSGSVVVVVIYDLLLYETRRGRR
jgi:hypothetical protein